MSVINKVLRDLEQRNAAQAAPVPAPARPGPSVRAVSAPRLRSHARLAVGAATVVAAAAAAAISPSVWTHRASVPVRPDATAPSSPVVEAPVAEAVKVAAPSVPAPAAAEASTPLPKPDALWGTPIPPAARPVTVAARAAAPVASPVAHPAPVAEAVSVPAPAKAKSVPANAVAVITPEPLADGRIERRDHPPTAKERAEAAFRAGTTALERGNVTEAQARFDEALAFAADHVAARQSLLGLMLEARRYTDAEALLLDGLDHVRYAPFALVAARLQAERGDVARAIATLESYEDIARGNAEYMAMLAGMLQRAGRHAEAVDRYTQAIAAGNPRAVWHMGRAISLRELGRSAESRAAFQQSLETGALTPEVQAYVERQIAALRTAG
jgi:MSHA biogenesis protein MshN